MEHQKLLELAERVRDKTRHGELKWRETADEDSFQALFDTGSLVISYDRSHPEDNTIPISHYINLAVLNRAGSVVDEACFSSQREYDEYESLYELFQLSGRSARDSDQVLDGLIRELG